MNVTGVTGYILCHLRIFVMMESLITLQPPPYTCMFTGDLLIEWEKAGVSNRSAWWPFQYVDGMIEDRIATVQVLVKNTHPNMREQA